MEVSKYGACTMRRTICRAATCLRLGVGFLRRKDLCEGGVFYGDPFSTPRISLKYSFKDYISNDFGPIVPKPDNRSCILAAKGSLERVGLIVW